MKARRDWRTVALAAAVAAGLLRSLAVTLSTGGDPWIYRRLRLDGASYIRGMESVAQRGPLAALEDPMHSVAYEVYLGLLFRVLGGPTAVFRVVKLLSWALGAVCALALVRVGETWSPRAGWAAAALFAWSQKWLVYSNVLDYATLAGALLTAALLCLSLPAKNERGRWLRHAGAAAALAGACALHFRFLPCWAAGAAAAYLIERKAAKPRRPWAVLALHGGVLALALPFAALAWRARLPDSRGTAPFLYSRLVRLANNPAALGFPLIGDGAKDLEGAAPADKLVEPSGLAFVVRRPARFAWLTAQRFLYICDIKREYWTAYGPLLYRPWRHPLPLALLNACLFGVYAGGALLLASRRPRPERFFALALVPAALLAPLLTFGSSRYLIPVLPCAALLQGYGVVEAARIAAGALKRS